MQNGVYFQISQARIDHIRTTNHTTFFNHWVVHPYRDCVKKLEPKGFGPKRNAPKRSALNRTAPKKVRAKKIWRQKFGFLKHSRQKFRVKSSYTRSNHWNHRIITPLPIIDTLSIPLIALYLLYPILLAHSFEGVLTTRFQQRFRAKRLRTFV